MIKGLILSIVALALVVTPVLANPIYEDEYEKNGQEVCPQGDGWDKVDNIGSLSYIYKVGEGFHVTDTCYKASTELVFEELDPPEGVEVILVSSVTNDNDEPQDISHASFLLEEWDEPEEPEEPKTPEEPQEPEDELTPVLPDTGGGIGFVFAGLGLAGIGAAATIAISKLRRRITGE